MAQHIQPQMTTTAFTLDGYRTTQSLGVVRGVTVRSRSILGTIGASLQTLVGGNITLLTELCEKTRADAFELLLQQARSLGANAVVGLRYDATEVMDGVTEVLCYGTAVIVGLPWVGVAAKQGPAHVVFWLVALALFYVPSAVVVTHLNRLMPLEGGL